MCVIPVNTLKITLWRKSIHIYWGKIVDSPLSHNYISITSFLDLTWYKFPWRLPLWEGGMLEGPAELSVSGPLLPLDALICPALRPHVITGQRVQTREAHGPWKLSLPLPVIFMHSSPFNYLWFIICFIWSWLS